MKNYEKEMLEEIDKSIKNDGYIYKSIGEDLVFEFEEENLSCEYCNDHYYEIKTLCKVEERYFIVEWLKGTDETPNQCRKVYEVIPKEVLETRTIYEEKDYKIEFLFNKVENILDTYNNEISYDIDFDGIMIVVTDYSNGRVYKILEKELEESELETVFFCFKNE